MIKRFGDEIMGDWPENKQMVDLDGHWEAGDHVRMKNIYFWAKDFKWSPSPGVYTEKD